MPDQKQDEGLSHLSRILGFLFGSNVLSRLANGQPQQAPPPIATPPFQQSAQQYLAQQIAANPNNNPNNLAIQQRLAQRPIR